MSRKCFNFGKGPMVGNNVSPKTEQEEDFYQTLEQRVTLEDGTTIKLRISAKELRTLKMTS